MAMRLKRVKQSGAGSTRTSQESCRSARAWPAAALLRSTTKSSAPQVDSMSPAAASWAHSCDASTAKLPNQVHTSLMSKQLPQLNEGS